MKPCYGIVPVQAAAFTAAAFFYALAIVSLNPALLIRLSAALLVVLSFLSSVHARNGGKSIVSLAVLIGLFTGCISLACVRHEREMPKTLAVLSAVTEISGIAVSDCQSSDGDYYTARIRCSNFYDTRGTTFSAQGYVTVLLPSLLVLPRLPGGIGGEGESPLFAGDYVSVTGKFLPVDAQKGALFMASGMITGDNPGKQNKAGIRESLRLGLARILYGYKESGGFLLALLSGSRDYLDPGITGLFRASGTSHILALSGMHLSLIGCLALKTGKKIGGKRLSIKLSLLAMVFFVWFAVSSPSLDRALIMALISVYCMRAGIKASGVTVLAIAFLIQMTLRPSSATSLSFMLSYSALLGILLFSEKIEYLLHHRIPRFLSASFSASLSAMALSNPITAWTIGLIAPVGIAATMVLSPLASLYLVTGIFLVFASLCLPVLEPFLAFLLRLEYALIYSLLSLFSSFPLIYTEDLPGLMSTGIISMAFLMLVHGAWLRRARWRSPDAGFARL